MLQPDTSLQHRYRIIRPLKQGGMGTVYEAIDERLDAPVALKECHFEEESLRRQFEREARLLARLRHPAMTKVIDHFTEGSGQFLVMEFIPGFDLSEMIQARNVPFPQAEVLTWADQLLDTLDYLHTQQPPIIHRDIKPQNLKLTPRGQIILLDFGLAKGYLGNISRITTTGSIFGYTPTYAPLEQIQGAGTDQRSDLYSLAATLYHLLTLTPPPDALTRVTDVTNERPDPLQPISAVNPAVGDAVSEVIRRAMSQNRERRPGSASEMRAMLLEAAGGRAAANATREAHPSPRPTPSTPARPNRAPAPHAAPPRANAPEPHGGTTLTVAARGRRPGDEHGGQSGDVRGFSPHLTSNDATGVRLWWVVLPALTLFALGSLWFLAMQVGPSSSRPSSLVSNTAANVVANPNVNLSDPVTTPMSAMNSRDVANASPTRATPSPTPVAIRQLEPVTNTNVSPSAGGDSSINTNVNVAPPPPPAPTPPPKPKTVVSGGVLNGRAVSKPAPVYPAIAKAARASGTVTVQILVDEEGHVISASAVSGHPLLQQAAVAAARQARFAPVILSGQPVKVSGVITYNFVLQ
jgi:TonB family protein